MPKAKPAAPRSKKAGRGPPAPPTSPEEFLAVGVAHEESAEKWRAGDATKSARFYARALAVYEQGLAQLPGMPADSRFDLEYNRARILYSVTQSAGAVRAWAVVVREFGELAGLWGLGREGMLRAALEAHRRALGVRADEPDVLFNTGMVLASLGEEGEVEEARAWLGESVEFLQQCLRLQEEVLRQNAALMAQWDPATHDQSKAEGPIGESKGLGEGEGESDGQWASVHEAVTPETLIETITSTLDVLTTLVDKAWEDAAMLSTAETLGTSLITDKLASLAAPSLNLRVAAAMAAAKFRAGLLEAAFERDALDLAAYDEQVRALYETPDDAQVAATPAWLVAHAAALTDCADGLLYKLDDHVGAQSPLQKLRWEQYSKALELLSRASKDAACPNVADVHLQRGDAELRRWGVAHAGGLSDTLASASTRATLLKNAATYYRGAGNTAKMRLDNFKSEDVLGDKEIVQKAIGRAWVAGVLGGQEAAAKVEGVDYGQVVQDMADLSIVADDVGQTLLAQA